MNSNEFDQFQAHLVTQGAFFHPALYRETINNIPGLYCQEDIAAGECLMSIPKTCTSGFDKTLYPPNTSLAVRYIHSAAKRFQNKELDKDYFSLDSLTTHKKISCYFFSEELYSLCKRMSSALGRYIADHNGETKVILDALKSFDKTISEDSYLETILNYRSRAMGQNGFVPGAVLFNHSSYKGKQLENSHNSLVVTARQEYKKGEQLYVSYGDIDLLKHTTSYNYFDPEDKHFVQFGKRLSFPIKNKIDQTLAQTLAKQFALSPRPVGMFNGYSIEDPRVLFSESGPSDALVQVAELFVQFQVSSTVEAFLKQCLLDIEKQNKVSEMSRDKLPSSLYRFYDALKKEEQIIAKNMTLLNT